jgi:hypothetical protein
MEHDKELLSLFINTVQSDKEIKISQLVNQFIYELGQIDQELADSVANEIYEIVELR